MLGLLPQVILLAAQRLHESLRLGHLFELLELHSLTLLLGQLTYSGSPEYTFMDVYKILGAHLVHHRFFPVLNVNGI